MAQALPWRVVAHVTESSSCATLTVHSYVFQVQIVEALHIWIKLLK